MFYVKNADNKLSIRRSQWPRGLRRRSAAARPLRLWVRIPPEAWMFVCCECCVLSGRGLCDGLITRREESYRPWRVVVYDLETSKMGRLKSATRLWKIQPKGCNAKKSNIDQIIYYGWRKQSLKLRSTYAVLMLMILKTFFCET